MQDFAGNQLKLGDRVITQKQGVAWFVSGEVVKLTANGAKIATDAEMRDGQVWRPSVVMQRQSIIIHLVEHNPTREAELSVVTPASI